MKWGSRKIKKMSATMILYGILIALLLTPSVGMVNGATINATGITLSQYSGPPGLTIWVNGTGFSASSTVYILWDSSLQATTTTNSSGSFSTQFTIPASTAGVHTITATDTSNSASADFTVVSAIYVNPSQGYVGTRVDVDGNGFGGNVWVYLYWDSTYLGGVRTDNSGSFRNIFSFNVPPSPYGIHTITAIDDNGNRATATFLVISNLVLDKHTGSYYTLVNFQCTGYSANKPIYIIWDMGSSYQHILASGYTDGDGSFSGNFRVPESPYGVHNVTGIDADAHADTEQFMVSPKLYAFPGSGIVGDQFYLLGYGYSANSVVDVYWDYSEYIGSASTNINGTFGGIFIIPYTTVGTHIIYAEDSNNVNTTTTYSVNPNIVIHPNHGLAGISANVNCTGFSGNTGIRIYWDYGTPNQQLLDSGTTDSTGSYNTTVTIPNSSNGTHSVVGIDDNNYIAQTNFYLGPTILINPDHGYVGTNVTVQGMTFSPNVNVNIYWDGNYLKSTTTNSTGDFITYIIVPSSSYGSHEVKAVDANGDTATANFFVLASITLSSYRGYVFDNITIHGTGFSANSASYIYWDSTNTMRSMLTDSNGEFTLTFQIPKGVAGYHSIYAKDLNGVQSNTTYFDILPSIKLEPSLGYVGSNYQVYCYGFAGNSILTLLWDNISQPYTVRSDANGSGVIDAIVPNTTVGTHNIVVYDESLNTAGPSIFNVLAVDLPVALSPSGYVNTTSPTLMWTSVDYAVEYELQYDTDPSFPSPVTISHITDTQYTITGLSDGITYYWRVCGIDSAGNAGGFSNVLSFTVDITPPSSSASVKNIYVNNPHITVYFNASDAVSGVKKVALYYSYEGGDYLYYGEINAADGVFDFYASHGDGNYSFYTIAYDNAGNKESTPTVPDCYVILDTVKPVAMIQTLPQYITNRTFNISFTSSDTGSGVAYVNIYWSNDGSTWNYYGKFTSSPVTFVASYDGTYYFQAVAVDKAGNIEDFGNAEASTIVDTSAPEIGILINGTLGLNGWYISPVKVSFTVYDSTSGVNSIYYSINGSAWTLYTGAVTLANDSVYHIDYYAVDNAGNSGSIEHALVKIDRTSPSLSLVSPRNNDILTGTANLQVTASDANLGSVEYKVDNGEWFTMSASGNAYSAQVDTTQYNDGSHTIYFRAIDNAGHTTEMSVNVIIDNQPPTINISNLVNEEFVEGTFDIYIYASDSVGISQVKITIINDDTNSIIVSNASVDYGSNGYWEYRINTDSLIDGNYTVEVYAEDYASHIASNSVSINVDNNAPVLTIYSPKDGDILNGTVSINYYAEDTYLKNVEYSVDNLGFVPINIPLNTALYKDGLHTIIVKASDLAGHVVEREVTVYFDNTPPSVTVVSMPSGIISGVYNIAVEAKDNVGIKNVKCIVTPSSGNNTYKLAWNADNGYYEMILNTTEFSDGTYTIKIVVEDESGKTSDVISHFTIDNSPPNIAYTGNSVISQTGILSFTIQDSTTGIKEAWIRIDGGEWMPLEVKNGKAGYIWSTYIKDNGVHHIEVKAIDKAGNVAYFQKDIYVDNLNIAPIIYTIILIVIIIVMIYFTRRRVKKSIPRKEEILNEKTPSEEEMMVPEGLEGGEENE